MQSEATYTNSRYGHYLTHAHTHITRAVAGTDNRFRLVRLIRWTANGFERQLCATNVVDVFEDTTFAIHPCMKSSHLFLIEQVSQCDDDDRPC